MSGLLISVHLHVMALIFGVIFVPLIIGAVRKWCLKIKPHDADTNNKLRLDVATIVPVGVLLWNLCIFYASNIASTKAADTHGVVSQGALTFEGAVAAAGESTVALAAAIIFARLFGSIWKDAWKV